MPCPSATFTVWASAWLVGAAAPDDVLDALAPWADAHDVQAADDATAAATALPPPGAPVSSLTFLMATLRRAGPRAPARLVLPAPGDVRGLPGPGLFSREATAAGEGVLFADIGLGVVPTPVADGVVRWTVYRVPEPGPAPEFVALSHAERDLRDQVRQSASVLTDLVIGHDVETGMVAHREFLALMQSKGTATPDENILEDAVAFTGVSKYPARVKCALLSWMAWKDATAQARQKKLEPAGGISPTAATPEGSTS